MRRRLLLSTLGVAAVAVLALGLPLLMVTLRLIDDASRNDLLREVQTVAAYVEDRLDTDDLDANRLARLVPGQWVRVDLPDGRVLIAGAQLSRGVEASAPIRDGGKVSVALPADAVTSRKVRATIAIGLGIFASMTVAAVVAVFSARQLVVPLQAVADRAARLGAGDFRPSSVRHGVPELDRVSDVLDTSGRAIADLLRRERDLASDISHQLRSRLTALRMRLEEIARTADADIRKEAESALEQTERLSGVVDELLAQARRARAEGASEIDVAHEVTTVLNEREPAIRRLGRNVVVDAAPGLVAMASPGRLHQAVGVLVDNALEHGGGAVTVRVRRSAQHALVEVTDEGIGVPAELVPRLFERGVSGAGGTGIGLALARVLVETDGGRLELRQPRPPIFAAYLPLARDEA
ncbi:MAG TPA: ATP-binding protein [Mycobacteriales bacterium]|nr:ATP-binding protein [Mycobacteriales bacterium]